MSPNDRDPETARARIEAAFPDLHPREVRYFGEGHDFRMFEVDETWLFRFPKRDAEIVRLQREVALMDALADRLPVAVPQYEFRAADVAGYRKLNGLEMVGQPIRPAFAASLGEFAAALHAIEVDELTLPGELDTGGLQRQRDDVAAGLAASVSVLDPDTYARCETLLKAPVPGPRDAPRRLVHNDIYPAHLLLNDDGTIRAVLDWGDAVRGAPSADFAVAYFWGGQPFLHAALERYAGDIDVDDAFEARARFGGLCQAIAYLTYGARTGETEYVECGLESLRRIGRG